MRLHALLTVVGGPPPKRRTRIPAHSADRARPEAQNKTAEEEAGGQAVPGPVSSAEAVQWVGRETSRGQHKPTRRQRQAREPAGCTSEEGAETERGQVRRPATDERTAGRADEDPHKPRMGRSSPAWRSSGI